MYTVLRITLWNSMTQPTTSPDISTDPMWGLDRKFPNIIILNNRCVDSRSRMQVGSGIRRLKNQIHCHCIRHFDAA